MCRYEKAAFIDLGSQFEILFMNDNRVVRRVNSYKGLSFNEPHTLTELSIAVGGEAAVHEFISR